MSVSYKKLWKLLIDKNMSKMDLLEAAGLSTGTLAKLGKNGNVTTDILVKICIALDCDVSDIMEIVKNNKEKMNKTVYTIDIPFLYCKNTERICYVN